MKARLGTVLVAACLAVVAVAAPAQAALPGENGKIAFNAYRNGNMDVYTVNPDGTGLSRLTSDVAWESDPAWSPDGKRIAFNQGDAIAVMDADGSNQRQVYSPLGYSLGRPSWSPDGVELAISIRFAYNDIFRIRADGQGVPLRVTGHTTNHSSDDPAWSPDGTKIAFAHYDASPPISSYDVHVVDAGGGGEVNLTPTPTEYEMMPNWSPDGRFIAMGDEFTDVGIRVMGADGSNRAVIPGSEKDKEPAFSPDGAKLAAPTWIFEAQHTQLVTYSRDGSGRSLVPGTELAEDPDWQPVFGPKRTDYKNAAEFCKAEREFFGDTRFRERYGGGANAYGKCVSAS